MSIGAGTVLVAGIGVQALGGSVSFGTLALAVAAAAVGSLAPDLDHPWSLVSFSIPVALLGYGGVFLLMPLFRSDSGMFAGMIDALVMSPRHRAVAWLSVMAGILLFGLSFTAGAALGHRGPVHSLLFGLGATVSVLMATLVLSGPLWVPLMFAWGWATHLAADATTKMGLPCLLWPFDDRRPLQ